MESMFKVFDRGLNFFNEIFIFKNLNVSQCNSASQLIARKRMSVKKSFQLFVFTKESVVDFIARERRS